jgi:hypothetical protein
MRPTNIRIIEDQTEEINDTGYEVSQTEKEALLAAYYPELYQKQYVEPKRSPQKRVDQDINTQKSNNEYYDVRFNSVDVGDDSINFKIEIKSDMKF